MLTDIVRNHEKHMHNTHCTQHKVKVYTIIGDSAVE